MRKCQSCHGDVNTRKRHTYAYVNGIKKYGCAPCCDSGAFDAWLDTQPDETKPCSPHANGPDWQCATHKVSMPRTCPVGYKQYLERERRTSKKG